MAGQKYISQDQAEELRNLPIATNFKKLDQNLLKNTLSKKQNKKQSWARNTF